MYSTSLIALIICWFDDWDASTALMKANKNSIFSGVNTVIFVTTFGEYYGSYTNVTCVGKKQGDHQSVINAMLLDLNGMETKTNATKLLSVVDNTWYTVQPAFLYLIADQPARRGLCGMLAGNSKFHPCFGYSMHILALSKPLAACKKCTKILFSGKLPLTCKSCLCWELPSRNNTHHMKYKTLIFPNMKSNISGLHRLNRQPGKLSFTLMKQVWRECYDDYHDLTPGRKNIW